MSSAEVAGILKRETSVRDVILAATAADVAVVGIGSVNQRRDATILRSGYISEGEQLMYARKGAVGDILGYFLNAEGNALRSWRSTKNYWASRSMNWRSCPPS